MELAKWLPKNFLLKLTSVILAIITWVYVTDLVSKDTTLSIPLEIKLAEKMILVSSSVDRLTLTFKGPAGKIDSLTPESFRIYKDLSDVTQPGDIILSVQDLSFSIPKHITIEQIFPHRVTVRLDKIITKEFKIKVVTTGTAAQGYVELPYPRVNPAVIALRGPQKIVENIDTVKTEPIDINGLIASKRFGGVHLQEFLPNYPLNKDKYVEVTVRIAEEMTKRSFTKIPIRLIEPVKSPFEVSITPQEVEVVLKGRQETINEIDPLTLKIFCDITNLAEGEYELPIEGKIAEKLIQEGVVIDKIIPPNVSATLKSRTIVKEEYK